MKRRFTVVALSAVLLLGLGSGSASFALEKDAKAKDAPKAKDTSKTDSTHDQMMAEMQKYATPGPMHDLLKPMVGTWKAVTKAWMSPGDPTVNAGTCENTWILGGRFLQTTYKGEFGGMPFEGFGIMGYDNQKKEFVSTWADNMGTGIAFSNGTADASGKVLTLSSTMTDPMTGKPVNYKMVTKVTDENQHAMSMITMKDGKEHTDFEISYTRVK